MESPHGGGQIHEKEPHDTVIEDDQGEKKSVFGKAKAKAKQIRATFTKHHHEHVPDDHDLNKEDDEGEEVFEDPKIHDASATMESDPHKPQNTPVSNNATTGIHQTKDSFPSTTGAVPHAPPQVPVSVDPPGMHSSREGAPGITGKGGDVLDPPGIHHSRDDVPSRTAMGNVDPPGVHHSRDNVPSKTTMGDVLDISGIHHRGDDDPSRTIVHGQQDRPGQQKNILERPESMGEDRSASKATPGGYPSSNKQTKVTEPTGQGGEEEKFVSVLHSMEKMKVYDESETGSHDQFSPEFTLRKPEEHLHGDEGAEDRPSNQKSSYTEKISSAAISAKNVVASKLGYGEKDNTGGHEIHPRDGGEVEKPSNQGGGGKISYATSAIAGTANPAKNVVASKLGYGEKDNTGGGHEMPPPHEGGDKNSEPTPTSSVTSKIPGTGTGNQQRGVEGGDKAASVKEHIAEKLRPGEEDKALAEVISEALHKPKPERPAARPLKEVVSDNLHLRNEVKDEADEVGRPMGKVTESEVVARRLGATKDDDHDPDRSEENKGMVDKIKGAVGSWLGKGDQSPGTQSPGSQIGSGRDAGAVPDTSSNISGQRDPQ